MRRQPLPRSVHPQLHLLCSVLPRAHTVGDWRDTSTLLRYQQPDARTMRAVVAFERPPESGPVSYQAVSNSHSYTHLPQIAKARHRIIRYRAFSCPSWARTRTLLIQSQACCQLHQGAVLLSIVMELRGIEPLTSAVRLQRSPS